MILSLACHPGLTTLPFISIIDIKPSSFGALSMIRDALPERLKHQVIMSKMYNSAANCINPNDTYYGARYPTPSQKNFMVEFWSLVTQKVEAKSQSDSIVHFLDKLISVAFKTLSDKEDDSKPRKYLRNKDAKVDRWVNDANIEIDRDTTYWELFDYFHNNEEFKKAAYVQKFAMPTIRDLSAATRNPLIISDFENLKLENSADIISYMYNRLVYFEGKFPAFSGHTVLNFSQAKIISLDLQPVAGNSTELQAHKTSIFYMLAQEVLTRNFLFDTDMLDYIDSNYHEYHKTNINAVKDTPKGLYFDEFHTTSMPGEKEQPVFSKIIQRSIESLVRVRIRVENIEVILVSQNPRDFSGALKDLYTSAFIIGGGEEGSHIIKDTFGLSEDMRKIVPELGKPGSNGTSFIMINNTNKGNYKHILFNPLPAIQLWGTSTTNEDVRIREYLYERIDPVRARKLLELYFPKGGAKSFVENMAKHRNVDITEDVTSITDTIGDRIMNGQELHYTDNV
jgi:intracellular multiplication protein IcmB